MDGPERWIRIRIRLVGVCFLVAFALIVARAFQLQVLEGQKWEKRAEKQHQRTIPLSPQRGTIYDRNGEELALSIEVDSVYVEPRKIADASASAGPLASALGLSRPTVEAKLRSKKGFLWIKRQVSARESEAVRALKIKGIGYTKEHRRFYPNSEIGAQVVGFTGVDPRGLEGIELAYDSEVLGQGGYLVSERDALGRGIGSGDQMVRQGRRGNDLYLSLDKNIQYIAEKELAACVAEHKAKSGTVVVLDAETGTVLAMASQPDYNPNSIRNHRPGHWRNRAVSDSFEPGSTFKIFLMAAALNEGVVRPGQKIYCEEGAYKVGGKVIHDHNWKGYADLSIGEIFKYSSNIGTAKIGKLLERKKFHEYLTAFGFGERTGTDIPGETSGLLRPPSRWFEVDLAAISFGQGLTVTPLQLALATSAVANGGELMAAPVVERIVDGEGEEVERRLPTLRRRVISEEAALEVRKMMVMATEEGGTGTRAAVPGFKVAGKTGTAQKVDPVTGGYSADKWVSSFVGFVPAEEPRLVILVMADEPEGKGYGGLVAAPAFSRIASQALRYLDVAPTEPGGEDMLPPMPTVVDPPPFPPTATVVAMAGDVPLMPDCTGMSYRQVLRAMERTGLNIKLQGSGRVVEQTPQPGRPIRYGNEISVSLQPPS